MSAAVGRGHSCQPLTLGIEGRELVHMESGALRPPLPGTRQTSTARLSPAAAQDSPSSGILLLEAGLPKRPAEQQNGRWHSIPGHRTGQRPEGGRSAAVFEALEQKTAEPAHGGHQ